MTDIGREYGIAVSDSSTVFAYLSDKKSPSKKDEVNIVLVEKVSQSRQILATPNLRRLIIEMYSVFDRCEKNSSRDKPLDTASCCTFSRAYRSVLYNAAVSHSSSDFMTDFALWSLYEKLWFGRGDSSICSDLISWANEPFTFFRDATERAAESVEPNKAPEEDFWKGVAINLLSCNFSDCRELLGLLGKSPEYDAFINVLSSFKPDDLSDEALKDTVNEWKELMQENLINRKYGNNENLKYLAKLLLGEERYLASMAPRVLAHWWQFLPFYVLVRNPFAKYQELIDLADECRTIFVGVEEDEGARENDVFWCLISKNDINFQQLISSNPWLAVHLVDLIQKATLNPEFEEMRKMHMLDYASALISHSPLWEIGAGYLISCGTEGLLRLDAHIEGLHIEDDEMAEQLLDICEDYQLKDSKNCVTNTMTFRYLKQNEWSAALAWALKTGSKKTIDWTVSRIISGGSKEELAALRVLESIATHSVLSLPSLTFLYAYQHFIKMMHNGNVIGCVQHLIPLIMMPDVPTQYYYDLFDYMITIIKEDSRSGIPFSKQVLYELSTFLSTFSLDKEKELNECYMKKVKTLKKMVLLKLADSIAKGLPLA
ncbi:CRE-NPP-2 protein [Caenorhabditis remanei]|uniref:Nuclear pore complex protein Nup85 n=1 Tax=Caenorhabditis remanei TaxID=31234 RepID=E3LYC0_CAERE|nr:CRE-NPP-2 protein [Caenorhabditis remanei]